MIAFVGFSSVTIPDWQFFQQEPKAPRNYRDHNKIAEYIEQAKLRQAAEASSAPLTSEIGDTVIYAGNSAKEAKPLTINLREVPLADYLGNFQKIAAIDAPRLIRLARIDYIEHNGQLDEETRWLAFPDIAGSFYKPFVFDPVTRLVGSEAEEYTDPWLVAKRFLDVDQDVFNKTYTGSKGRALLAIDLSRLLGL